MIQKQSPLSRTAQRAVGDVMNGAFPGCPVPPSSLKYIAQTQTIAAGATATFTFAPPGVFCPFKMLVFSDDIELMFVTNISSGLEDQVISGVIPAELFSIANHCCPTACMKCTCAPGVPLTVTIVNNDATEEAVTVVLVGAYLDACPPTFMLPENPGCPGQNAKFVGFTSIIPAGASETFEITTPGRFCPHTLFFGDEGDFLQITAIESGLKDQIISGAIPAALFTVANECCVLACFDCLCAPGYPLKITIQNTDAEGAHLVAGVLVGEYTDFCP